ncbi:hypothetical protein [Nannocystis punicea]|uniref:Uncharacterized protein n=1 Tax=Nannocystis punicea TaxID=2995304 RepID=A0ABY7HI58_9BACT|nr:hypothetical protein [Nannocystis poenicansa]WAS98997.1 hypothetical protein O0S08_22950 [Nannocystis poenicansa]
MRLLACSLALGVALASPVHARPPTTPAPPLVPTTENDKVNAAIQAWSQGNWARVRALLEPMLQDGRKLGDPLLEEAALRYLSDATLQDPDIAPVSQEWATGYIKRLLASSPDWRPPADTHSKAFYDLYNSLREERDRSSFNMCKGERAACIADLDELKVRHGALGRDYERLRKAYEQQEVEVVEKVARNRAVALVPFGVGHFYNGRKGLGGVFLASELALGATALGLFITRALACDRLNGYQPGSLVCDLPDGGPGLAIRNAEQTMGILFLGSLALDIVLAQILFRPFSTAKRVRVPRSELKGDDDDARGKKKPAKEPTAKPGPRSSGLRRSDILQIAPAPTLVPGGGGLGVKIRF